MSAVCTDVNVVLRADPRLATTVIMAIEMPAAISPYSMAVAPDWFWRKRAKILDIRVAPSAAYSFHRKVLSGLFPG